MILALLSVLFSGAIFGFFFAWVSSTMWGLDAADPQVAIAAMQAMNASVRNAVFAPTFFGTPLVLLMTAAVNWRRSQAAAMAFAAAALIYGLGGLLLTMLVNVPMNEVLAQIAIPADRARPGRYGLNIRCPGSFGTRSVPSRQAQRCCLQPGVHGGLAPPSAAADATDPALGIDIKVQPRRVEIFGNGIAGADNALGQCRRQGDFADILANQRLVRPHVAGTRGHGIRLFAGCNQADCDQG